MYAEDNKDKIAGLGRQLRAAARATTLDPEDLGAVFDRVRGELEVATAMAVQNLREQGHSWSAIGRGLGISRQAAHKAYGGREATGLVLVKGGAA